MHTRGRRLETNQRARRRPPPTPAASVKAKSEKIDSLLNFNRLISSSEGQHEEDYNKL